MREILFRGERVDNGEWVYGSFIIPNQIICKGQEFESDKIFTVIPETVGQYTGLTDKNGKKIFEGDIVKFECETTHKGEKRYLVYCINFSVEDNRYCAFENGMKGYFYPSINFESYIYKKKEHNIIGNIYDNPELLNSETI